MIENLSKYKRENSASGPDSCDKRYHIISNANLLTDITEHGHKILLNNRTYKFSIIASVISISKLNKVNNYMPGNNTFFRLYCIHMYKNRICQKHKFNELI